MAVTPMQLIAGGADGRVHRDLQLQVAYTYAKAIDPATGSTGNGWDLNSVTNPYVGSTYDRGTVRS